MKKLGWILLAIVLGLLAVILIGPFLIPIPPLEGTLPPQQLADPDSQYMRIGDVDLHYKKAGTGEPSLVLLHGFPSSAYSWREVLAPLSKNHTVVAYDRPGFGLTSRPLEWSGENPYSPDAQPEILLSLMDELGLEQSVLVGNSAGGALAIQAALENPERVKALVLVAPAIYQGNDRPSLQQILLNTPQGRRAGVLLVRQIAEWGRELGKTAWHDPSKITPEIWDGYTLPLKTDNWDKALLEVARSSGSRENLADRLSELNIPVLVIAGDDDRIVPTQDSIRAASEIPGAELVVIPNCGHAPQEECPNEFLAAVNDFLARLEESN